MPLFPRFLRRLWPRRTGERQDVGQLRIAFQDRYHNFKLLLGANNKALQAMAEMQTALAGSEPYSMTFVREKCTRAATSVYSIIQHLDRLAPDRYRGLMDRFTAIQEEVKLLLDPPRPSTPGALVVPLTEIGRRSAPLVGTKMATLGEIGNQLGLDVPQGFVITTAAYCRFMEHDDLQTEIDRRLQATRVERLDELYALSAALQRTITSASIPDDLAAAIRDDYRSLEVIAGTGVAVAMRSSALAEDLPGATSAGQYRSALNVSGDSLLDAYKEVVASKYRLPAMTYRLQRGIRDEEVLMCVGCMCMVDAASGGVVYSRNPIDAGDDSVVVNAVLGLPASVVDGSIATDCYVISRGEVPSIRRKDIRKKLQKYVLYAGEGIRRVELPEQRAWVPSLSDETALELARLAIQLEDHYGAPQDIEWALTTDGSLSILQCRPLSQTGASVPAGEREEAGEEQDPDSPPQEAVLLRGGITASPGAAVGEVFALRKDSDVLAFPDGAVLVAAQALPRWAALLSRAAAVVTEQGGVAGHLATVAREFAVPALLSVEGALERLRPGQVVTVDADRQLVFAGEQEELLRRRREGKPSLMAGSSVEQALASACERIVPLHLLDPDAISFRPESCETLHDITRFCHEKSVTEMFSFGRDHHFSERSSKQLFVDVAMNWWVLNLDDGFREEVDGKYVRLDNIACVPMLALWQGIAAVPWQGPPPLDGKGFMSVMFQATQNRALTTGVRSKYAERNYFMISRNYCSLSSRLGFHFSTVETLVSERTSENYLSFQFKGGAADYDRRRARVVLVQQVLEEYGFRVQIEQDNLIARLEQQSEEAMVRGLVIVGYLTIHTRQLDMIMANEASAEHYRAKIADDLRALVGRVTGEPGRT